MNETLTPWIPPCKNCTDRYTACHDYCGKYRIYKQYAARAFTKKNFERIEKEIFFESLDRRRKKRGQ